MATTDDAEIAPHVVRMSEEYEQLADRHNKLQDFIIGPVFATLPEEDQRLMNAQMSAMHCYAFILYQRLERANVVVI